MRTKLIVGNWKMNKTLAEAERDFSAIAEFTQNQKNDLDVGIAAPFLCLPTLAARNFSPVKLFAQNAHWKESGAFTGEISVPMLSSCRVQGSLVGHSERRQFFGDTNQTVGLRMGALLKANMEAIFCVGETLAEREAGTLKEVLKAQLEQGFLAGNVKNAADILGSNPKSPLLSIAYEPVWAIGTGKAATPVEAEEAHAYLRELLAIYFGTEIAQRLRILYGGSVKPDNISRFLKCENIDGALVGGASLVPKEFVELIQGAF
jgi:triosephosphate isomerase